MDLYYSHLSDEDLFLQMSHGDRDAYGALYLRYRFFGNQAASTMIRTNNLFNCSCYDFTNAIDDGIDRAIRYYNGGGNFSMYCKELITQSLNRDINEFLTRNDSKAPIYLDSPVSNDGVDYHEIIHNPNELSIREQFNFIEFFDDKKKIGNVQTKKALRIFQLKYAGYTLQEISKKMHCSVYDVRHSLDVIIEYLKKQHKYFH